MVFTFFVHAMQATDRQGNLFGYRNSRFFHGEWRESVANYRVRVDKKAKFFDRAAIMAG